MVVAPDLTLHGSAIYTGAGLLSQVGYILRDRAPAATVVLISDTQVAPHWADTVVASLAAALPAARVVQRLVAPGEATKTRRSWAELSDAMLDERCGRDTTIVALGGGVVGDLAGFVAATYMRGIPVVQVPTSLLAMVDASVGGKVGVDTRHGKNLIGAFHHPRAVVVDPAVLQTLDVAQRRAGLAEVLKHGLIASAPHLDDATALAPELLDGRVDWRGDTLRRLVLDSISIKAHIVEQDPTERGMRRALNFGHTVGHAIEHVSGYSLLHGEAVAIGMVAEAELATAVGVASTDLAERTRAAVRGAGLPEQIPAALDPDALFNAMRLDKKAERGMLRFALPTGVGTLTEESTGIPVPESVVRSSLDLARRNT